MLLVSSHVKLFVISDLKINMLCDAYTCTSLYTHIKIIQSPIHMHVCPVYNSWAGEYMTQSIRILNLYLRASGTYVCTGKKWVGCMQQEEKEINHCMHHVYRRWCWKGSIIYLIWENLRRVFWVRSQMMLGHNYVRIASDIFPITPRNGWADICESCSCWEGYFGASSDYQSQIGKIH